MKDSADGAFLTVWGIAFQIGDPEIENALYAYLNAFRYKSSKNRIMPSLPNQPSEASAHFMFELAKTVLVKAGGNSSTSLFINQSPAASNTQTHRALHLCAFQIGLYALGLNNCVSPNWLSRTYSSHVSWITGFFTSIPVVYDAKSLCFIGKVKLLK